MDFFTLGEHINVKDLNALIYLLRKFKRLNTGLKLGALTLTLIMVVSCSIKHLRVLVGIS